MTVLVSGDCLVPFGPLADPDSDPRVLMIEAREFARRKPYHPHKLTLVFSAMRHFRDALRADGYTVEYRNVGTFAEGFDAHFRTYPGDRVVTTRRSARGATERLRELVETRGGAVEFRGDPRFLCSPSDFDEWADGDPPYRHEDFYRHMRRETGYLITDGDPVGGEWNFDEENRGFPGEDYDPPEPPRFVPDETTAAVAEWVTEEYGDDGDDGPPYGTGWADPDPFFWPVTREEALSALSSFTGERLRAFGPYQDAMLEDEWAMNHALLSSSLNLGLLRPAEVIESAIDTYEAGDAPIESVEGFVRQVLGWREFVRHAYRREPGMAYVDRMGDYCSGCPYYKTKTTGEGACPFNALYWDFLGRNEERLRSNHRMGLVYSHWDDKDDDERETIHERAGTVRRLAAAGEL